MLTAYRTDIGFLRTVNEDRVLVCEQLNGFTLAIVADGMGGHQAGDVASEMAINIIQTELLHRLHVDMVMETCGDVLQRALHIANERIFSLSTEKAELNGMGTTVVLALANQDQVIVANIGDSRAYVYNGQSIVQVTEDHSLVTELVKTGQISIEESYDHPQRNVLTRALGTESLVDIDFYYFDWNVGDVIMLCSDGLTGLVSDEEMKHILSQYQNIEEQTERLIALALEAGGKDNISVALLSNIVEADRGESIDRK